MRTADPGTRAVRGSVLSRVVAILGWGVIGVGLLVNESVNVVAHHRSPGVLLVTLSVFFALLLLRLVVAIGERVSRRGPLVVLLGAIASWAAGSASVTAARVEDQASFPAPGEWLFLLSYLGLAVYLLTAVDLRAARPARAWLDSAVICGGTACLASLLLVMPIQLASGQEGISLLLALLYPGADLALALLVVAQATLRLRTDRTASLMLSAGFLLIAVADSSFALRESAGSYDFGNLSNALWGAGFALVVGAACRPEPVTLREAGHVPGTPLLLGAGAAAMAVLAVRPGAALAWYTLPPAVLTMVAVGVRLALALRDARRANEAAALSRTDDLTDLPNRRAVRMWLQESLRQDRPLGLMLLDLDGFKEVNDSLGHRAGDTVLRLVAVRMREVLGPRARVARLGGDEFAILLDTTGEIELMEIAHAVLAEIGKPLVVEGIEFIPAGSIGVTTTDPGVDHDDGDALRRADVAMYQAKETGLGVVTYDAELDQFSRSRLLLAEELRRGITQGQIEVWYQPQFAAGSLSLAGLEALVRWRHPEHGLISPVSFLPDARRTGLMGAVSDVVVRTAAADLRERLDAGIDLPVSINIAPPELLGPGLVPRLLEILDEFAVPHGAVLLEITEDSFLADPGRTRELLRELDERGVGVSIDDYGTGFSSLTYLRDLPVRELKIDRSLIGDVAVDPRTRMVVGSTIQLAHALDMTIVAEGVENAADLEVLVELGIDVLQGYHLAEPMSAGEVVTLARRLVRNKDVGHVAPRDRGDRIR